MKDEAALALSADAYRTLGLPMDILVEMWAARVERVGALQANLLRSSISVFQMSHSRQLLKLAERTARKSGWKAVAEYLDVHAKEEEGHFNWGLDDYAESYSLAGIGTALLESSTVVPFSVMKMIDKQYEHVASSKGLSRFFGYVVALEGFPAQPGRWELWCDNNTLPHSIARSPIRHAILDQEHRLDLFYLIAMSTEIDRVEMFDEASSCFLDMALAFKP
jgi:hypothetical protein